MDEETTILGRVIADGARKLRESRIRALDNRARWNELRDESHRLVNATESLRLLGQITAKDLIVVRSIFGLDTSE